MLVLVFARLKPFRGGAYYSLTQRRDGLWPGDKIFLLGREIKPVFRGFARLTIPAPIRMMFRALHTYGHGVNRVKN